jgi:nucleotide-binding universal stress UspA family protein
MTRIILPPKVLVRKMRTILAAVDQSHHAHDVMSRGAEMAVLLHGDLVVLSVISSDPMKQSSIVDEQNRFASFHRELIFKHFPENSLSVEPHNGAGGVYRYGSSGLKVESRILAGNVVDKICACAEEINADIVLVGSRGLGNIGSLVLGSVSERVVHKCPRSVMVVKGERLEGVNWEGLSTGHKAGRARA